MKRLVFLLLTITFIVVSSLSIKQFEYIQFQSFNNNSGEKWNIIIESGNPQKNKSENFKLLEDIAIKSKVNIQRTSYEKDENNNDKLVYYVAFYENDDYFKNIKLHNGTFLNVNSSSDEFMSTINTHNKNQIGQIEIFKSFDPIEIRPIVAAEQTRDIKGTYTVDGKSNAENVKNIASEYGFSVEISKDETMSSITEYPYQNMISKASIILYLLIALAMLYDVISNYKEISVRYMLGFNFWEIGSYLFKKYIMIFLSSFFTGLIVIIIYLYFYNKFQQLLPFLYFNLKNIVPLIINISLIFIIIWLLTKTINISLMIKNKKPIKSLFYINIVIRFVLAFFLTLGLQEEISTFIMLKSTLDKQEKWNILKDYSYLGVVSDSTPEILSSQNDDEKLKFKLLYEDLEKQGAFYISPSAYYMDDYEVPLDSNPWGVDGMKIEINKNYLDINPIVGINNKKIELNDYINNNEITVLVPIKFNIYENDIKKTISDDYTGIYNKDNLTPPNVNIIYVKDNQSYFTFSTNMAQNNNYEIIDPIAVIVNSEFDPRILALNVSMGYGYYTKNSENISPFKLTQDTLKKYSLEESWQPISVAYSNVELSIENKKEWLELSKIYCLLFIILAAILLFFSLMYYLEINKKTLAIQWIFGYTFLEKHYLAYLFMLVFWNFIFAISFVKSNQTLLLAKIILVLILFDIILISIILSIKDYSITKKILIDK